MRNAIFWRAVRYICGKKLAYDYPISLFHGILRYWYTNTEYSPKKRKTNGICRSPLHLHLWQGIIERLPFSALFHGSLHTQICAGKRKNECDMPRSS